MSCTTHSMLKTIRNEKGSVSPGALLGADLFVTLLILFIASTAILLKAPAKESAAKALNEGRTPDISLPVAERGGKAGGGKPTTVSARKGADGVVEYFVGDKKVSLQGIADALKQESPEKVELRLDESLTNSTTIKVLSQLQAAGTKDVSYAFTVSQ